jgi:hypothetical protein
VAAEPAGLHCAYGGVAVSVGSGSPTFVCNGLTGAAGADGLSALVDLEPAGPHCAEGGVAVSVGAGAVSYVCHGTAGAAGADGLSASVSAEPAGAHCAAGGVKIQVGLGLPTYACNGAAGAAGTNATVTSEPAGAHCLHGGVAIAVGAGLPSYVCNGADGATGAAGAAGLSASVAAEPAGPNCALGGVKVQLGAGAPSYACNGADGQSASVTPEPAAGNCAAGGVAVQVGAGAPSYVCNGLAGGTGPAGGSASCAGNVAPVVTGVSIAAGPPRVFTVNLTHSGTDPLSYTWVGNAGTFAQIGTSNQFTFQPSLSGGPFNFAVIVSDGCSMSVGSLTGVYAGPHDVTNLNASPGAQQITLSWTNPSDASFDHVEISAEGFATVSVMSWEWPNYQRTISGLTPGQTYTFTVTAMDAKGNGSPGVQASATPYDTPRYAFVSSWSGPANMDQPGAHADEICQTMASQSGLPGTYVAWLSWSGTYSPNGSPLGATHAVDRLTEGAFQDRYGEIIARSLADLTDGFLETPFYYDETGSYRGESCVWTGTQPDGLLYSADTSSSTCSDWASGADGSALTGMAGANGPDWTNSNTWSCATSCRLYCFQR